MQNILKFKNLIDLCEVLPVHRHFCNIDFFSVLPELTDVWGIEQRRPETQSRAINSQMFTISKEMFYACGYYSHGSLNALILTPFALAEFNLKEEQESENFVESNYLALL